MSAEPQNATLVARTGVAAAAGALIVGLAEFLFQYAPGGGYEDAGYIYFRDIEGWRLTAGHFIGVLAAPVYLVGYWHIGQMLRPAGRMLSAAAFGLGAYAFAIGNVWLGGRVDLALIVQAAKDAPEAAQPVLETLLVDVASHNEPLIYLVRILIVIVSVLMAIAILGGRSHYPRAMIIALPAILLALIFAAYVYLPDIGTLLLPAAMNIAHAIFFLASALAAKRIAGADG